MSFAAFSVMLLLSVDAQPTNRLVRRGVERYEAVDFRGARRLIEQALNDPGLSKEDTEAALACLARAYAVLEEDELARVTFIKLLSIEPGHAVGDHESRRIAKAFAAAQAALAPPEKPSHSGDIETPEQTTPTPSGSQPAQSSIEPSVVPPGARTPFAAPAVHTVPATSAGVGEQTVTESPQTGWERWRWLVIAGAGVLTAGAAAGLWWHFRDTPTHAHPDVTVQLP